MSLSSRSESCSSQIQGFGAPGYSGERARGIGRSSSRKAPKHPALRYPQPASMSLTEDSQVDERVGDASAVTFAEEEETASIT